MSKWKTILAVVFVACAAVYVGGRMPQITQKSCFGYIAREAEDADPGQTENQYLYLMSFQRGYEHTALGHETIMYQWKSAGMRRCFVGKLLGLRDPVPKFAPPRACDVVGNEGEGGTVTLDALGNKCLNMSK